MKGNAGIFVIIGIIAIAFLGFLFSQGYLSPQKSTPPAGGPQPSPSYARLSDDPRYKEVKEKYNLSEEQLQILSTVNPDDND